MKSHLLKLVVSAGIIAAFAGCSSNSTTGNIPTPEAGQKVPDGVKPLAPAGQPNPAPR